MRARVWTVVAAACLVALGCEDGGNPVQVIGGGAGVLVVVGNGSTPSYSWSGGRARSLSVQSSSGEVFWQVEALSLQEGFAPPAQHGITPVGARVVTPARALQPGIVHNATVVTVDGTQGTRTFTPTSLSSP
jgi:hypothetical protein